MNIHWKKKLLKELPAIFSDKRVYREKDREELEAELYRQPDIAIIQLKVELEWLKKKSQTLQLSGSHHIFTKDRVEEILNLQPKGNESKPYQVKQVRNVILKYKLGEKGNE